MDLKTKLILIAAMVAVLGLVLPINDYAPTPFNGTLSYGESELNFTEGLVYKYNNVYIFEHYSSQMFAISTNLDMQQNDIVNLNITNTKNITISGQSGTGTRAACFDASGHLIASTNATSNYLTC